jgi:hypothetical protein
MKKTLTALALGLAMTLSANTASALTVGDVNYIGAVVDGVPAGDAFEVAYVNSLLDQATGTVQLCLYATDEQCRRTGSSLNTTGFADASLTGLVKDESGNNTFNASNWTYVLAKYGNSYPGDQFNPAGQISLVWYVGNLSGTQTVLPTQGLSHLTLLNPRTTVPDGGATLGLLGLGMLALGYLRRRKQ